MLKKYDELGTAHRGDPCQEYPGVWWVMVSQDIVDQSHFNGGEIRNTPTASLEAAIEAGEAAILNLENMKVEYNPREIKVCWQASENDPRYGQTWFTSYYQHGYWNLFGQYRTT